MKIKIIITTTDSDKIAIDIAEYLVKGNLSPCIQITPNIKSVFMWKGKLEKSGEVRLLIKTIPAKIDECKELILKLHNYEVPELIVTDVEILNNEYADWFIENCPII